MAFLDQRSSQSRGPRTSAQPYERHLEDQGKFKSRRPRQQYEADEDQDAASLHDHKRLRIRATPERLPHHNTHTPPSGRSDASASTPFQNARHGSSLSAALSTTVVFLASMIMQAMAWTEETFFNAAYRYKGQPHVLRSFATIAPGNYHDVEILGCVGSHPLCRISDSQRRPWLPPEYTRSRMDDNQMTIRSTGRWGEDMVFGLLLWQIEADTQMSWHEYPVGLHFPSQNDFGNIQAYKSSRTGWKVYWLNANRDSRLPYDILIEDDHGALCYVEVKTTTHQKSDTDFKWSSSESDFAFQHGHQYVIYRVYDFGQLEVAPSLVRRVCPYQLEKEGLFRTSSGFRAVAKQLPRPDNTD